MNDITITHEMITPRLAQRIAEMEVELAVARAAVDVLNAKLKVAEAREVPSEA